MHVFVVGLNHRSAPLTLRERVAFAPDPGTAARVASYAGLAEAVVLSTWGGELAAAADRLIAVLADRAGVTPAELREHAYVHLADDAVRHLCRVAAGLDSLLVGETQIVGQLRRAFAEARESGAAGRVLHRLSSTVLAAGRRARARLVRPRGPGSVAELAVHAVGAAGIAGRTVLVVGAGETAADVLDAIAHAAPARVVVTNRSAARAEALAARHRAEAVAWEALAAAVGDADVVFACTAAPEAVVGPAHLAGADARPRAFVDLGVPRNVDPALAGLPGVKLLDVDALGTCPAPRGRAAAAGGATAEAEAAVAAWVERFGAWLRAQDVVPTIAQLRADAERIRELELARALARLGDLEPREREVVRALAARLVNKLLHAPLAALNGEPDAPRLAESARVLFALAPRD